MFSNELGNKIEFEQNADSIYEGWMNGGSFTEESLKVADGKKYDIIIEVDVLDNGLNISEYLAFEMDIKGYKSFVLPT